MHLTRFTRLLDAYERAPREYQATRYWRAYERRLWRAVGGMDFTQMRSGRYPILATFGFGDAPYVYHPNLSWLKKSWQRLLHACVLRSRTAMPFNLKLADLQALAFRHCELLGQAAGVKSIREISMSRFGGPRDLFEVEGKPYAVRFLGYFVRHCFVHRHRPFHGREVVVELGPGCGYQLEVLHRLHPEATILCFDLPAQIFLCETYLTQALGAERIVSTDETLDWKDLAAVKPGRVHFFGNWQFPLLRGLPFDLFWNAASFGEMEPDVVENYLGCVRGGARSFYLLQAQHGKQQRGRNRVETPVTFEDYDRMLPGYELAARQDAWQALRPLSDTGGYFEALWNRKEP
jgi:putative sugar O-methyltransferase